ncbi:MAG TPA: ERCC4 domain-containing protein [Candidatus Acidoferrales bacterium]|nr:ERCC4 domain-containing protein [Candidatus Acidoferrales bacterium]
MRYFLLVERMSGTESLLPYLREKKQAEQQEPTIIVDSREANTASKIVKGLRERGVTVKTEVLEKGDYVLSDVCAVERKTVQDFVYTLTRRFLFEQLFRLKEVYPKSIILLEGYLPIIYKYSRIQPASVWGAMFNLARNGVAIINTTSYKETVDFLYVAARQEQIIEKRAPTVHPFKRVDTTADAQVYFLASLPNVGREKALAILKCYQTPLNAVINVDDWSETVHGLGPKISSKVKEVLNTPFRE